MYPTISLGGFGVSTYASMRVAAVVVLAAWMLVRLRRGEWPPSVRDIADFLPFLLVGLLAGAWLESSLPYLVGYVAQGTPLPPQWWMGRRWLGALAGGALAGYVRCRRRGLDPGRSFDLFAVPLPLALGVARAGCLLAGCCYGRETTAWPSLFLPDEHGVWASRYPVRIASIGANLFIFAFLLGFERWVERWGRPAGWPFGGFLFLLFVVLHLGQRFVFEFWRADTPQLAGPFTWTHPWCAAGIGLAAWLVVRRWRRVTGAGRVERRVCG